MKKYYIIRADGSSLFELPYPEDFVYHCLIKLLDRTDEQFKLMSFQDPSVPQHASPHFLVSLEDAFGAVRTLK